VIAVGFGRQGRKDLLKETTALKAESAELRRLSNIMLRWMENNGPDKRNTDSNGKQTGVGLGRPWPYVRKGQRGGYCERSSKRPATQTPVWPQAVNTMRTRKFNDNLWGLAVLVAIVAAIVMLSMFFLVTAVGSRL
jgi:hypothetical protein